MTTDPHSFRLAMRRPLGIAFGIMLSLAAIPAISAAQPDPPDRGEDRWWDGFRAPGLGAQGNRPDHAVVALEVVDGELVVGGKVRIHAGTIIHHAARFDGTAWRALGDGPGNVVEAAVKHGDDLICLVAGEPRRLRRWDGTAWTTLCEFTIDHEQSDWGRQVRSSITSIASFNGEVILGGIFDEIEGVRAENIAAWDGSNWHPLGSGLALPGSSARSSDCVTTLALFDGMLVAGGFFSESGPVQGLRNIAAWDGTRWHPIGTGLDAVPEALAIHGSHLYAVGDFHLDDWHGHADRLLRWNGHTWKSMRPLLPHGFYVSGIAASPRGLVVNGVTGFEPDNFIVFGDYSSQLGLFDGRNWEWLADAVVNGGVTRCAEFEGKLVAGGTFTAMDDAFANGLAILESHGWKTAVQGNGLWIRDDDFGLVWESGVRVYLHDGVDLLAGGAFESAGGQRTGGIARWDGVSWQPLGDGINGGVSALAHWSNRLVVGGGFSQAGGVEAKNIATWDGVQWAPLGPGLEAGVTALANYEGSLIAGGYFNRSGDRQIFGVARWDGTVWQPMRFGLFNGIKDLVVYQGQLLAGGTSWDGRQHLGPVARWTGEEWVTFGALTGHVERLRMVGEELYAVGLVRLFDAGPQHRVVRWNGTAWDGVGARPDLIVKDIEEHGGHLVASTLYTIGQSVKGRLYTLRNGNWEPLSRELNAMPGRLGTYQGNLYCGGHFRNVGPGRESIGIARWDGITTDIAPGAMQPTVEQSTDFEPIGFASPGRPLRIAFRAGTSGEARIDLYDVRGRRLRSLGRMPVVPGRHVLDWDGRDERGVPVARGLYFIRLQIAGEDHVRKIVVASR